MSFQGGLLISFVRKCEKSNSLNFSECFRPKNDNESFLNKIASKVSKLRIFNDEFGKMNKNINDINGEILLVSQFTLCADTKRGNRPSFKSAMEPKSAKKMFDCLVNKFKNSKLKIKEGKFGETMDITLKNNGPMTIFLDTKS